MAKRLTLIAAVILILSIFSTYLAVQYHRFLVTPLSKTKPIHIILAPGGSVHSLTKTLQAEGVLKQPRFFLFLAYYNGLTHKLKPGEYFFDRGATPHQIINQLLAGHASLHHFTIVEGWTFKQLMTALNNLPNIEHTLNHCSTEKIIAALDLPPQYPEGIFFPATYYFSIRIKDTDLLKWAHRLLEQKLQKSWQHRQENLPYKNPYQALIAASLVEKETAVPKERPMIAGVIARRLQKGMPLQIDSSIIYGLGNQYMGKLTLNDLHRDAPYNTYTRRGLPSTPIGMPSLSSIHAVLHPDHSQNLYFVSKGDGSHQFSNNLIAHNQAVQRYQIDNRYPLIRKKIRNCRSLWYLSKNLQMLFCRLNEVGH